MVSYKWLFISGVAMFLFAFMMDPLSLFSRPPTSDRALVPLTTMPLPEQIPLKSYKPSDPKPIKQFPTVDGDIVREEGVTNQTELGRLVQDHPKDTIANLKHDVKRTVARMKNDAETFKDTLNEGAENVKDVYDSVTEKGVFQTVTEKGGELKEAAKEKVSDIVGEGTEKVKQAFNKVGEKGEKLKDFAKDKIADLKDGLSGSTETINAAFETVGKKGEEFKDFAKDKISDLKEGWNTGTIKDFAKDKISDLKEGLSGSTDTINAAFQKVGEKGEELKDIAKDKISDLKDGLSGSTETVNAAFEKAGKKGEELKDLAKDKASDLKDSLKGSTDAINLAFQKVGEMSQDWKDAAKGKILEGAKTVSNKGEELKDAAKATLTDVKDRIMEKVAPEPPPPSKRMWFIIPILVLAIFGSLVAMSFPSVRNAVLQFGRPLHRPVVISHHRDPPIKVYDGNEAMARIEEPLSKPRRKAI